MRRGEGKGGVFGQNVRESGEDDVLRRGDLDREGRG